MATFDGRFKHDDSLRDRVAALWMTGLSAREIAGQVGGVTRSAVMGIVHRLGLTRDGSTLALRPKRPAPARQPRRAKPLPVETTPDAKPVRFKIAAAASAAALAPLPLAEHDAVRPCQWPCGTGEAAGICGRPRDSSDWRARYCVEHRIAGTRPQQGGKIALRVRPMPEPLAARQARPFTFAGCRT